MTSRFNGKSLLFALGLLTAAPAGAADIWVSPTGSDQNPGTKEKPLASVAAAVRQGRELRRLADPSVQSGVHILLRGGEYRLYEPLFFRPEDSGTASNPTVVEAAPGEKPVLSGGVSVKGWRKTTSKLPGLPAAAQGNVWVAEAPRVNGRVLEFRQLWINDRKATRAREVDNNDLPRLLAWDKTKQEGWIPTSALAGLKSVGQAEMVLHQMWAVAFLRLKTLEVQGAKTKITFQDPESQIEFEHPWPSAVIDGKNGSSAFYLTNAIEFLDRPGEWFYDAARGQIIYWPRSGETMTTAKVVVPALETLVQVSGNLDHPVSNVFFKGLTFAHTGWLRPAQAGHVPLQAGMFMLDAYKLKVPGTPDKKGLENQAWIGRPAAAVTLSGAHHTGFERCRFEHLASAGLDYVSGTHDDAIVGCVFRDIGGNGIQMATFSDAGTETHLPYNPSDEREICSNELIENNLVVDCGNEDWGCVGIGVGYGRGITIRHNEIAQVPYTGISLGWGWTKTANAMRDNKVQYNYIHHYANYMYDVAGIYTLSAQPNTLISENCVDSIGFSPYVHDPNHWFYLYLDEGSSNITVRDNWCPAEKFLANANGPSNVWQNNGPMVADRIKQAAGLEPAYRELKKEAMESQAVK
jgi:hypothetical protein